MKNEITTQDRRELKKALSEKTGARHNSLDQYKYNNVASISLSKKGKYSAILEAERSGETIVFELESFLNELGYKIVENLGFHEKIKDWHLGVIIEKSI